MNVIEDEASRLGRPSGRLKAESSREMGRDSSNKWTLRNSWPIAPIELGRTTATQKKPQMIDCLEAPPEWPPASVIIKPAGKCLRPSRQVRSLIVPLVLVSSCWTALLLLEAWSSTIAVAAIAAAATSGSSQTQLNEYQLIAPAQGQARLPCLIGKQSFCGEPYFIAWYKLNATSRLWTRIEAKSRPLEGDQGDELAVGEPENRREPEVGGRSAGRMGAKSQSRPLAERVHFDGWSRETPSLSNCLASATAASLGQSPPNETNQANLLLARHAGAKSAAALLAYGQLFDCAQLAISALELQDEGQFKCEITFSDSLDPDRCPASTVTQLNVIARPNEPQILLNGRPLQTGADSSAPGSGPNLGAFKEGAQVRLECQSSGGKPAPRIEWLNLTSTPLSLDATGPRARHELQLMRWRSPIKRAHFYELDVPVSSSSLTITLSRFDLQSRFVCVVLAGSLQQQASSMQPQSSSAAAAANELPASLLQPGQLAAQLDRLAMLGAAELEDAPAGSQIKWIKLDILARPTSVTMQVLDLATNSLVRPLQMAATNEIPSSLEERPAQQQQQQQPFYSLQPNRLYAIQCLVENSRPRSQVAWFNRTSPIELETIELEATNDFTQPASLAPKAVQAAASLKRRSMARGAQRLRSFVRYSEQAGFFRTEATLLLMTNFYDNFEELFCRISNGAFQFDELLQVAPILSVRIYVNYPLSIWLESAAAQTADELDQEARHQPIKWNEVENENEASGSTGSTGSSRAPGRLGGELGQRLQLRCQVAANPLTQNSILQIEWLKDGRRLQAPQMGAPGLKQTGSVQQTKPVPARVQIEKANHLHMPLMGASAGAQSELGRLSLLRSFNGVEVPLSVALSGAARLLGASLLTISSLVASDAGLYSCQYKLIPAPTTGGGGGGATAPGGGPPFASGASSQQQQQQQQQIKILSGQATQAVQLDVIEAKLPILRVASSSGLIAYDKLARSSPRDHHANASSERANRRLHLTLLVADPADPWLSFKCELNQLLRARLQTGQQQQQHHHQKIVWHLDGQLLHSSPSSNRLNSTRNDDTRRRLLENNGGRLTCSLELPQPQHAEQSQSQSQSQSLSSANSIQLRFHRPMRLLAPEPAKRRELMPSLRSFSELELSSQPANKLKLVCLAQCEPVCSIDWLVNSRPLVQLNDFGELRAQTHPSSSNASLLFRAAGRLGLAGTSFSLAQVSSQLLLVDAANRTSRRLAHTSLGSLSELNSTPLLPLDPSSAGARLAPAQQLELVSGQLAQDFRETGDSGAANVLSRLELSYSQLGQLLAGLKTLGASPTGGPDAAQLADQDEELQLECRLNELLDARQFAHFRVQPNVWYPAPAHPALHERQPGMGAKGAETSGDAYESLMQEKLMAPEVGPSSSNEDDQLFLASSAALNLSSLFSSAELDSRRPAASLSSLKTRILLEHAPKRVFISLQDGAQVGAELNLNEQQLKQLLAHDDANPRLAAGPILSCQTGRAGSAPLSSQFRWTFSSFAPDKRAELVIGTKQELDLRHLIRLRQRQLDSQTATGAAHLVQLMASIFGNYTCFASNLYGTLSASFALAYRAPPVCSLQVADSDGRQPRTSPAGVSLRCEIYSSSVLLESVWLLRNNQTLVANQSGWLFPAGKSTPEPSVEAPFQPIVNWLSKSSAGANERDQQWQRRPEKTETETETETSGLVSVELPLNTELMAPSLGPPPKCLARNSFGLSEACELSPVQLHELALAMLVDSNGSQRPSAKPATSSLNLLHGTAPAAAGNERGPDKTGALQEGQLKANSPRPTPHGWLVAHLDWILIGASSLLLLWFVSVFGGPLVRRRLLLTPDSSASVYGSKRSRKFTFNHDGTFQPNSSTSGGGGSGGSSTASSRTRDKKKKKKTATTTTNKEQQAWRFQSGAARSTNRSASPSHGIGLFASKFGTTNSGLASNCYYGGLGGVAPSGLNLANTSDSNGADSSEHDMVQSCSQSSQYEDFIRHQLPPAQRNQQQQQQQQFHQQALYFNQSQLIESTTLSRRPLMKSSLSSGSTTTGSQHYNDQANSLRRAPVQSRLYASGASQVVPLLASSGTATAAARLHPNVHPLVSGAHTSSRIQFNELQRNQSERNFQTGSGQTFDAAVARARRTATGNGPSEQEHIYDDVIYTQMIL